MDCELLTVGTELVLGLVQDSNAADLGRALAASGVRVRRRATVADEAAEVRGAVAAALERCGTVIVTGGLGPTHDDLTRQAVAQLFGKRLRRDPQILATLEAQHRRRGVSPMPEANRSQADVPEGATVLPNPLGTAPGLWIEDEAGRLAVLLPGVPSEMRALLEREVLPRLRARMDRGAPARASAPADRSGGARVIRSRTIRTTGVAESALADLVREAAMSLGPAVTLASLPSVDGVDLRLTAWELPPGEADAELARAGDALRAVVAPHAYGDGDEDLAAVVLLALERAGAKLAVAESCTGGLLGARLTAVPGSSTVFLGAVVAYDDEVKLGLLGVAADAIAEHGAVSEAVVRQMSTGVARALGADAAIAVTGIAGPAGGTEAKPVGTVWIAVLWHDVVRAFRHVFPGERDDVRRRAAQAALNYLRRVAAGTL
ncbi:MAG: CinA family nicotinamide mononucleotide deamidase-related protein [Gemmatimonadetes bacterium]|nr:CinA family nicotinamide mononucleotide deamidase-related protein [Gemmatimonadota bacterium]